MPSFHSVSLAAEQAIESIGPSREDLDRLPRVTRGLNDAHIIRLVECRRWLRDVTPLDLELYEAV
jgi:hypothetical protein